MAFCLGGFPLPPSLPIMALSSCDTFADVTVSGGAFFRIDDCEKYRHLDMGFESVDCVLIDDFEVLMRARLTGAANDIAMFDL